ncbi:olfactory receptor 1L6-like [Bombina bombina]|uniref:olfactory receptor 1L6-like n=1 Tax=Bombina bombina TaxID=8345 RepID=UPI00235AB74E|nr:olfactory receptor 1L6-like [Bombina bombina]
MDNQTIHRDFHILAFSAKAEKRILLFIMFFFMYVIGVSGNLLIITLVYLDKYLHTPMYLFLSNLSLLDLCLTTTIVPKLLDILLTGNNNISFFQCFTQMYFYLMLGYSEIFILSSMAYDRSVAICSPLHYNLIMTNEKCILILGIIWMTALLNSTFCTYLIANVSLCHSKEIHNFYCDAKGLIKTACSDISFRYLLLAETIFFILSPFLLIIISYIKIIYSILQINSVKSRRKTFSTCTSHITVVTLFFGSALCIYFRPSSEHLVKLDQVFYVIFTTVTPILNPLIYSIRNKNIKTSIKRLFGCKFL